MEEEHGAKTLGAGGSHGAGPGAGFAAGALAFLAAFQGVDALLSRPEPPPPEPRHLLRPAPERVDLASAPPRFLRRLPGLGTVRAVDLARARWEHGGRPEPLALEEVPGIGPVTAARVRAALGRTPEDPLVVAGGALSASSATVGSTLSAPPPPRSAPR